jgi:hypothetical protein
MKKVIVAISLLLATGSSQPKDPCKVNLFWIQQDVESLKRADKLAQEYLRAEMVDRMAAYLMCEAR